MVKALVRRSAASLPQSRPPRPTGSGRQEVVARIGAVLPPVWLAWSSLRLRLPVGHAFPDGVVGESGARFEAIDTQDMRKLRSRTPVVVGTGLIPPTTRWKPRPAMLLP